MSREGKKRKHEADAEMDKICADEPGKTLGQRLAARASKRHETKIEQAFRDAWPKFLRALEKAADDGHHRVDVTWKELGVLEDYGDEGYDTPNYALLNKIHERLDGTEVEYVDSKGDHVYFDFPKKEYRKVS